MRITGGRAKGIQLQSPKNNQIRPATDYLREALFASLSHATAHTRVLDLFAGTGAYGLEALSRGAQHVTFIEHNRRTIQLLTKNLAHVCKSLGVDDVDTHARTLITDALKWKNPSCDLFDLVIVDPPYPLLAQHGQHLIQRALPWLSPEPNACLVLEAPGGFNVATLPEGFIIRKKIEKKKHQPSAIIISVDNAKKHT